MASDLQVAVLFHEAHPDQSQELAQRLMLPLLSSVESEKIDVDFVLCFGDANELLLREVASGVAISASFLQSRLRYRLTQALRQEMLVRAVGCKGLSTPSIIDATAGLGQDALLLAAAGCQVTLIERSPILLALLEHALSVASSSGVASLESAAGRMQLIAGDSCQLIPTLPLHDVIYMDPMFPQRRKSASVGKNMAILQRLLPCAESDEGEALLTCARGHAGNRVVVKRPRLAPALAGQAAAWSLGGRSSSRFDIYRPLSD